MFVLPPNRNNLYTAIMAEMFPGQHSEEEVEFVFRQHPVVMRKALILSLGLFTVAVAPIAFWPHQSWAWWSVLVGFVVALLIFGYRMLSWYFSVFIITNERFIQIKQRGFFDKQVQDIAHSRIQSVNYQVKGMQETMFKFGTITIQTFVGDIKLRCIHHPEEVQQHLNQIIRKVTPEDPKDLVEEGGI